VKCLTAILLLLLTVSGLAAELRGFACHIVDGDTFDRDLSGIKLDLRSNNQA
jgi:hypothetical protein